MNRNLGGRLSAAATALAAMLLTGSAVLAVEEPAYETVAECGDFEIRRYPAAVGAVSRVSGDFDAAGNQGFRALARYIFGGNGADEEIAMTAPVAQSTVDGAEDAWNVVFYMPSGRAVDDLPSPTSTDVELRRIEPKTVAVLEFSGFWTEQRFRDREMSLRQMLAERSLPDGGRALWARYDPPWTLWFLRRNEIWIELGQAGPCESRPL